MPIIDSQMHMWTAGKPSPHHSRGRPDPFAVEHVLAEMDAAGVDGAILAPPAWDPGGNGPSLAAARAYPNRFAVTGAIDWLGEPAPMLVQRWRDQPGMYGLRLIFNTPEKQAHLRDGTVEWIWATAERADVPVMLLVPGGLAEARAIAERHPGLRLCIDHLGIPRGAKDGAAFAHLPDLVGLARLPNVSVKAGGLPAYSSADAYPYPSIHGYLRQVYDGFGPERIFWASDLSRMSCPYREVVTLITEGIPWLTAEDKRLIMGDAVCRWLGWQPEAATARATA
ncbi:MAG TPA: amidohydrolase family protein [Hyphomicrobiales bacterium]|nr:amidohydrolase family protein [Hyphomicrobiales bacterium]